MKPPFQLSLILSTILISSTLSLSSQQTYLHAGVGYGFRLASSTMAGFYNNTLSQNSYTESQILLSVGAGTSIDAGIVIFGGDYLGFAMKYSHLFSQKATSLEVSNVSTAVKEVTNTISGSFNRIEPTLILRGEEGSAVPYMQFGPVISFGKASWHQIEEMDVNKNTNTWEYSGGMAAGFTATMGVTFELGTLLHLFVETSGYSMSWAPEKKIMTEAYANTVNLLPTLPLKVRQVDYVDERTVDYGVPVPDNQPDIQLRFTVPMSSIGIKAGIRLEL